MSSLKDELDDIIQELQRETFPLGWGDVEKTVRKDPTYKLSRAGAINSILTEVKKRLPQKYTLKTGLLWDSQDATDGFNACLTEMEKELEG